MILNVFTIDEDKEEREKILKSIKNEVKPARHLTKWHWCKAKYRKVRDKVLLYIMQRLIDKYPNKAKEHIFKNFN